MPIDSAAKASRTKNISSYCDWEWKCPSVNCALPASLHLDPKLLATVISAKQQSRYVELHFLISTLDSSAAALCILVATNEDE